MNKNMMYIIGAVVALIFVVILFFLFQEEGPGGPNQDADMSSQGDPTLPDGDQTLSMEESLDPRETLARYKKWAQYPPTARPLHAGQVDLLEPYDARRPPIGILKTRAEGCEPAENGEMKCAKPAELSDIKCEMTPERAISIGRGDFKVTLSCVSDGDKQKKPLQNLKTKFYRKFDRAITNSLPPIAAGDDGQNGDATAKDLVYTILVRPTAQDWGYVFVEASFTVAGLEHVQRANWFSTPTAVADFQGGISDRLGEGSLVVSVPVLIRKAGYYNFQANLQEAGGDQRFVASASKGDRYAAGQQMVEFVFFGKVIKDTKIDGPYIVREIRGRRENSPVTPDILKNALLTGQAIEPQEHKEPLYEYIEPVGANYTTASYRAEDFSDREWESEEKERRIQFLTRVAAEEQE